MKPARTALRPKQIRERFGIPPSTLHYYCTALPEGARLPSMLLPSRGGMRCPGARKHGVRLVFEDELLAWLEKHRQPANTTAA